jgi:hypothetical protein
MNKGNHPGKQLPETNTQREVLIQERTTFIEETDTSGALMTSDDYRVLEHAAAGAGEARPPATHQRHRGDLSESQFRLLENLERLTHSLQGPEQSLDRVSYNRPFPPVHRPVSATTKPAQT